MELLGQNGYDIVYTTKHRYPIADPNYATATDGSGGGRLGEASVEEEDDLLTNALKFRVAT